MKDFANIECLLDEEQILDMQNVFHKLDVHNDMILKREKFI